MTALLVPKRWKREASAGRSPSRGDLSAEEQEGVRRAIRFLRARLGSRSALERALGVAEHASRRVSAPHRKVTARLALAVARAGGVSVEDVLTGAWPAPEVWPALGKCPRCGK